MVLLRPSSRFSSHLNRQVTRSSRNLPQRRIWQKSQRRSYSSSGEGPEHATHKSGSDLPWAITSIGLTVPAVWYLAQPQLNKKSHGGGHGHDDHASHNEHGDDTKEEGQESSESGSGDADAEKSDDGAGDSEGDGEKSSSDSEDDGGKATPDTSDDNEEADQKEQKPDQNSKYVIDEKSTSDQLEGVRFKGASNATDAGKQSHTALHIPDAKGGAKKRLESHYGNKAGEATTEEQSASGQDYGAASKAAGNMNTQSGKQEGLTNTDTKHSTEISSKTGKSTRADGQPETAKQKGTVDPSRPLK